ncbi:SAM-dependent methyltransferase [Streptomyces zagrosensis]|uniref:Cyclopropane fatty-acyl-phospholipid synthase-like methyltransferase n=1 Tax=Streptomyces zagrosensis TaxID=1042984 RepID=A0A7W9UZ38_9ACTN|nr:class I SAM-dependent methyltransferase [Streptomyces zagrosensis]MBB5936588.1 cyclopropane fatty-acyl-phospholipid synthase-like methyltransferase [Streptomyces zagrosensis]
MEISPAIPRLTRLTFHGPLSEARATRIIDRLVRSEPRSVLDIGCGWGELLLRTLEAAPAATGAGIDLNAEDLARGRANATARGLAERVAFYEESGADTARGPADVVLCTGSSHALSGVQPPDHTAAALKALRGLVNPGGRVLLGEGFWQRTPSPAELAVMWPDASANEYFGLADVVDLAVAAGFRPEWIETANNDEWEEFQSAYRADLEEWLAAHSTDPAAAKARERAEQQRAGWLRGHGGVLGLAYLTLIPVG